MPRTLSLLLVIALLLTACTAPPPAPTATPTPRPTSTVTPLPSPTATSTPTLEPTPTKEALPSRWDDPELLADVRADFEAATGMSVEDYYNKAVEDGLVTVGISKESFGRDIYATATINGIGLGVKVVEANDGRRHLVVYFARKSVSDGVGIYPLDVALEENGVYAQTAMDSFIEGGDFNAYRYPVRYASVSEAADDLGKSVMGNWLLIRYPVRFRSLLDCASPQNAYLAMTDEGYWGYMQELCRTEGTYLNALSQERISVYDGSEYAVTYNIDAIMERGVPDSGLVPVIVGIYTP